MSTTRSAAPDLASRRTGFNAVNDSAGSNSDSAVTPARHVETTGNDVELVRRLLQQTGPAGERRERSVALGALLEHSRHPLTAEEERVLFRRLQYLTRQAEAIRCSLVRSRSPEKKRAVMEALLDEATDVRRRIAESSIRLVVALARKFTRGNDQFQELVSDGLLILLGAIDKFDVSRGFRLSTYATHAIQRHYFRATQRMNRYNDRFVLTAGDVMAAASEAVEIPLEDGPQPDAVYRQLMASARGELTQREEFVLNHRFGTGGVKVARTLRETAAEMGISKERVRQIQTGALEKLRAIAERMQLVPQLG